MARSPVSTADPPNTATTMAVTRHTQALPQAPHSCYRLSAPTACQTHASHHPAGANSSHQGGHTLQRACIGRLRVCVLLTTQPHAQPAHTGCGARRSNQQCNHTLPSHHTGATRSHCPPRSLVQTGVVDGHKSQSYQPCTAETPCQPPCPDTRCLRPLLAGAPCGAQHTCSQHH